MRALKEFNNWIQGEKFITAEGGLEEAYTTGFNRAIQLMETFLEEKEYENFTKTTSSRSNTEREETSICNRH
jgi:hypothetical protein